MQAAADKAAAAAKEAAAKPSGRGSKVKKEDAAEQQQQNITESIAGEAAQVQGPRHCLQQQYMCSCLDLLRQLSHGVGLNKGIRDFVFP